MSKIQKYIEDAVAATVAKTGSGVNISSGNIDSSIHVDNGDVTSVLESLAQATIINGQAIMKLSTVIGDITSDRNITNNSIGIKLDHVTTEEFFKESK